MTGTTTTRRLKAVLAPLKTWLLTQRKAIVDIYLRNPARRYIRDREDSADLSLTNLSSATKIIVFLVPGYDIVNGGVRSIASLAEETDKIAASEHCMVAVCSIPGDPPLRAFTKFKNSTRIYSLQGLLRNTTTAREILIHVPEIHVRRIRNNTNLLSALSKDRKVHFNILIQNIDFFPEPNDIAVLKTVGEVSASTAHKKYHNETVREKLGCNLYHFSTFIDPSLFNRKPLIEKENLIILSPDYAPERDAVIEMLKSKLSDYKFRVVKNINFETYCEWIRDAKFVLTFGEGLDGYFVESIFSGAIGCAVYNDRFFTEDFINLPFVFLNWTDVMINLPKMAIQARLPGHFEMIQSQQYDFLCRIYRHSEYVENLRSFYRKIGFVELNR